MSRAPKSHRRSANPFRNIGAKLKVSMNGLNAVSSNSRSYSTRSGTANTDYFIIVVQQTDGLWQYINVTGGGVDTTYQPVVYDLTQKDTLLELWKRVVLDGAIPWGSTNVRPESMRIVRIRTNVTDAMGELFEDRNQMREFERIKAVAKLSDDEARLLGLTSLKAKQIMLSNPDAHSDDVKLLAEVDAAAMSFTLTNLLE